MATRIRLQRYGKKGKAFFHLVVADSRAKRDGKFIEKLGIYNPNTNPATIDINFDNTLKWVRTGAEMSDTARAILSYKGVLYKNHLIKGIAKGALTEAEVEKKFNKWLAEKDAKINAKKEGLSKSEAKTKAAALKAEAATKEAKAKEIEAKNLPMEEIAQETISEQEPVVTETEVKETEALENVNPPVADQIVSEEETTVPENPEIETPTPEEVPQIEENPAPEEEETPEEDSTEA